eukprot:2698483-Amphidinium_carterae.1
MSSGKLPKRSNVWGWDQWYDFPQTWSKNVERGYAELPRYGEGHCHRIALPVPTAHNEQGEIIAISLYHYDFYWMTQTNVMTGTILEEDPQTFFASLRGLPGSDPGISPPLDSLSSA